MSNFENNEMVYMPGLELVRSDFKTALEFRRQIKRMTQKKLSEKSGVNLRTLQDYEQGKRDINGVRGITLYKLAQALECKIEDLLEGVSQIEGEWISVGDWILVCSICDNEIEDPDTGEYPKYCHECGNKMKAQIKKEVEE